MSKNVGIAFHKKNCEKTLQLMCKSLGYPITGTIFSVTKSSNWIAEMGHPHDQGPII